MATLKIDVIVDDDGTAERKLDAIEKKVKSVEQSSDKSASSNVILAKSFREVGDESQKAAAHTDKLRSATVAHEAATVKAAAASRSAQVAQAAQAAAMASSIPVASGWANAMNIASGAAGLFSVSIAAVAGSITAVVASGVLLANFLVNSARMYFETSRATKDSRDALEDLKKSWQGLQMLIGASILGSEFSIAKPIYVLRDAMLGLGVQMAFNIDLAKKFFSIIAPGQAAVTADILSQKYPDIQGPAAAGVTSWQNRAMNPGLFSSRPGELVGGVSASEAMRLFEASQKQTSATGGGAKAPKPMPEIPTMGTQIGIQGQLPGQQLPMPVGGYLPHLQFEGSIFGQGGMWGLSQMPGVQMPMPVPPTPEYGFFNRAFGGMQGFGQGLGSSIFSAISGGGNPFAAGGSYIGQNIGSELANTLTSGGGINIGGFAGGALNAVLPGVGALLGPLMGWIGGLFGPTDYEKRVRQEAADRTAFNQSVDMSTVQSQAAFTGRGDILQQYQNIKGTATASELSTLLGDLEERTNRLQAAMDRYGISWEELGEKAKQAHVNEMAEQFIQDFEVLYQAGVDTNFIIEKMGSSVNEFVAAASRTGTEVPLAMKPMLEQMVAMGLLTDASGQKLEDLSTITFSESLTQGIDRIVDAINNLSRALGYDVPQAAAAAQAAIAGIQAPGFSAPAMPAGGGGGYEAPEEVPGYSDSIWNWKQDGAYITQVHQGGFIGRMHRGGLAADERLAVLQTGEFVMSRQDVARAGGPGAVSQHRGTGGSGTGIVILVAPRNADADELLDIVETQYPGRLRVKGHAATQLRAAIELPT